MSQKLSSRHHIEKEKKLCDFLQESEKQPRMALSVSHYCIHYCTVFSIIKKNQAEQKQSLTKGISNSKRQACQVKNLMFNTTILQGHQISFRKDYFYVQT